MKSPFWLSLILSVLAPAGLPQSAEITPPASVVHEGIPPVPASLGRETSSYRSSPGLSLVGSDPEKPQVVISSYCMNARCASRVDGPGRSAQFLLQLPAWYRDISYEPGGNFLVYTKPVDENFKDQIYRCDLKTKETTLLTDGKSRNRYPVFSSSGKLLAYSSNRRNGRDLDVYVMDPLNPASNRMLAELEGEDWAVFDWSPDGKTIAFVSNQNGIGRLHLMDVATRKEMPIPEMPVGVVSGLIWHRRLPYVGFVLSTTKFASDVFSINVETLKLERWTTAYSPIKTDSFKEPEIIKWRSFDGQMISGFFYRPPETFGGKRPVIIDIHGGPTNQFRPHFRGEDNYFINGLGVACIYPNVRGSTGYGKTFMKLDDGVLRQDAVKDIGALLDWISNQPGLDAGRIMVKGNSSGGYLAMCDAEQFPGEISAVLSYIAPTHLATFIERSAGNEPEAWRRELGDERDKTIRDFFVKSAPVNNADKIKKPAFLILGGKDLMTSAPETERIIAVLRKSGVPVWYLLAKDEGHTLIDIWTYNYAFNAHVLFVKKYLFPESEQ